MKSRFSIFLLLGFLNLVGQSFAQKAEFGISMGTFRVPNQRFFEKPKLGFNLNLGLYYSFKEKWSLGTHYNNSVINYVRESVADTPLHPILGELPIEGKVNSEHFSFLINRKITIPWWDLKLEAGTGFAILVEENNFYAPTNFDTEFNFYTGIYSEQVTSIQWQWPLRYAIYKPLGNRGSLGFEGGLFFDTALFIRGIYFGPRLTIGI
jgi:hypothetical protein